MVALQSPKDPSRIVRSLEDSLGSPRRIVRSLEDSLGSPSRIVRSLEDSLGSPRRIVRSLEDSLGSHKRRGAYPTPPWLVDLVVAQTITAPEPGATVVVVDPACGDGRFLAAAAHRVRELGGRPVLVGVDIDGASLTAAAAALAGEDMTLDHGDALGHVWPGDVDVVVGNPPYLSQMASATSRGGASVHGGGPYADAAVEFLAIAVRMLGPNGRLGLVLPQSILASRDAAAARAELDARAGLVWSWWSERPVFDAQVLVCAIVAAVGVPAARRWTDVVTAALGVPALPAVTADGTLRARVRLTANFRDQYYGLLPAVVDDGAGPRLVTSGLIDPGRSVWGARAITFGRRRFERPTVELGKLTPAMRRWAADLLVPKVLVANQTRVVEAVVDDAGSWLPGVPAITARPQPGIDASAVAAVLTSPVASAWVWHRAAGTGLAARSVRLGPRWLGELPWPVGDVARAVEALRAGDVITCGRAVTAAYGVDPDGALAEWWVDRLPRRGR